jgi:hypothetical protein
MYPVHSTTSDPVYRESFLKKLSLYEVQIEHKGSSRNPGREERSRPIKRLDYIFMGTPIP